MRDTITHTARNLVTGLIIVVQVFFLPLAARAQETPNSDAPPAETTQSAEDTPEEQPTAQVATEQTTGPSTPFVAPQTGPTGPVGPQQPTGAASTTYVLNEDTGLWENDYYTWDPVTKQTRPKTPQTYSYNPTTKMWDTTEWYYSPEQGKYVENTISTAQKPPVNLISNTGPNSNNTISNGGNSTGNFDLFFDASISNKIGQMGQSGDASVDGNTLGGDATSGDALGLLNVLSMIQSAWGELGSEDIALFMANIDGDINGDLMVNPNALSSDSANTDIDVTVSSDSVIHNDIDVVVASGDANVSNNTTGGNAKSGNVKAVINLLNLINSAIKYNKSFIGILNINGNLNGDILLPPDMIKAIIAATGPSSNNQISQSGNTSVDVSLEDNRTINNDITTDVNSGDANVSNNTTGGKATTGNAKSNLVLLNLTGQKVVTKNALLVFVNVMGSWVGLIFDAPAGTNAVAATGPNSNNTIIQDHNLDVTVDSTSNSLIDNDINVSAESGDASVTGNTKGGNAVSGDAEVGINVLNMIDSEFDVSDWFGVLFINVFGTWTGSFGVNTAAGDPLENTGLAGIAPSTASTPAATPQTFAFIPKLPGANPAHGAVAGATNSQPPTFSVQSGAASASSEVGLVSGSVAATHDGSGLELGVIAVFIGAFLLGGERLIALRRSHQFA